MLCNGFTIPNFNPKKDNFFVMLHFTDGSIFFQKRNSVNSFISVCHLKDQKLPVSAIKTQIEDNRPKISLARQAHKWSRQLACSNYGPNRAIGTSANVRT